MASVGYVKTLLNKLPADLRVVFEPIVDEMMSLNRIGDSDKAQNFAWFATEFTTHAIANTEFTVEHGLAAAPSRFIPSVKLDTVNSQLVPLVVSRAADAKRAYFKSSVAGATVSGHFE